MKTSHKWLFVLMTIMLVGSLMLAACNNGEEGTETEGDAAGEEAPEEGTSEEGKSENEQSDQTEQVLHMSEGAEPPNLDSATLTDGVSATVIGNTMEGLYRLDEHNEPQPAIAEDVEISDDGLTYTFHLRDAVWSDGSPVTAHDFEFAWKRSLDPDTKSQYAFIMFEIKNAEAYNAGEAEADEVGVEATDEKTLKVTLEHPVPYFLSKTAFSTYMPQKEAFIEEQGDHYAKEDDALLYNGPFKLTDWRHEAGWVYVKNDDYWDADSVKLDKVTVDVVKQTSTGVNLYEAGDLDVTGISGDYVEQFQDRDDFTTRPEFAISYLIFNTEDPFLKNEKIRRAISGGFDRETYVEVIANNGSKAAYGFVTPGIAGPGEQTFREYAGDLKTTVPSVEEAKTLFEEGLEELGLDEAPTVEYLTDDNETARKTAEYIQQQLKENLGFNIEINQQTFSARLDITKEDKHQIVLSVWSSDYNDPLSFIDLFMTGGPYNDANWSNDEYDERVEFAQTSGDNEARMEKMKEAEQILIEEATIAPLIYRGRAYLWQTDIEGLIRPPYGPSFIFRDASIQSE